MGKILVILESPGKIKKVQGFLGTDKYIVKASIGHIRNLDSKNGVDKKNGFKPNYVISEDKIDVVKEIKALYKQCGDIILLTDMDKEGEQIAYSICEVLGIDPTKTKRGVTAEITEKGIKNAINNPGVVNMDKVYAQQCRRIIDRLVGYDLSGLVIQKIQKGLSAGRVQSVATLIIVERENEISKFESGSDFKIVGLFEVKDTKNKLHTIKAILNKRFKDKTSTKKLLEQLIGSNYTIKNIETKSAKRSPSAPFTTSSIQQEAARKYGYSVDKTMQILQRCYEQGWTTYMRTDSVTMSQEAVDAAASQIINLYGKKYSNPKQYKTKALNSADAHECIRPTHFEDQTIPGTEEEKKMYDLVWKRTIASQMSEANLDRTTAIISSDKIKEEFIAKGEVLLFDGFLRVYEESNDNEDTDSDESGALPPMQKGQSLSATEIQGNEIYSKPAPRYTQASLVKRMEELGVGRPSTFASTIKTIIDRGYVEIKNLPARKRDITYLKLVGKNIDETIKTENFGAEQKKIFPTDIGKIVTEYLVKNFPEIINYKFTAEVELKLDKIESGEQQWDKMIAEFYEPFAEALKIAKGSSERPGGRHLGVDPKTGKPIQARIGKFGPMVQMGEAVKQEKPKKGEKSSEKPKPDIKFAKIPEGMSIDTITLDEALSLLSWPKLLGDYKSLPIVVNAGPYGDYVKHNSKFYSISIPKETITLEEAIEVIKLKEAGGGGKGALKEFDKGEIKVLDGKFGPYISYKKKNFKVPAQYEATKLTKEECLAIIGEAKSAPKKKFTKFAKKKK